MSMSKQKGYQITFLDIFIVAQCTADVRDVLKRSSEIFSFTRVNWRNLNMNWTYNYQILA